jgi:hypothetical protein
LAQIPGIAIRIEKGTFDDVFLTLNLKTRKKGTHNWLFAPSPKVEGSIQTGPKDAPPPAILMRAVAKPYHFNCRWRHSHLSVIPLLTER